MNSIKSFFSGPQPEAQATLIPEAEAVRRTAATNVELNVTVNAECEKKLTKNYYKCLKTIEHSINILGREHASCQELLDRDIEKLTQAGYGIDSGIRVQTNVFWGEQKRKFEENK